MNRPRTSHPRNSGRIAKVHPELQNSQQQIMPYSGIDKQNFGIENQRVQCISENYKQRKQQKYKQQDKKMHLVELLLIYEFEKMGFKKSQYDYQLNCILKQREYIEVPFGSIKRWAINQRSIAVEQILRQRNQERVKLQKVQDGFQKIQMFESKEQKQQSQKNQQKFLNVQRQQNNNSKLSNIQDSNIINYVSPNLNHINSQRAEVNTLHQNWSEQPHVHDQQQQQQIICQICYMPTNSYQMPQCHHYFCPPCMKQYIRQNLRQGIFIASCPEYTCDRIISENQAEQYVQGDDLERFLRFKKKAEIENNPDNKFCSSPDCGEIIQINKDGNPTCPKCKITLCLLCNQKSHPGQSCNIKIQQALEQLYNNFQIKKCPSCSAPIQKIDGCNHMTCKKCKAQFCWICLGKVTQYHYRVYNCCGCPGLQFADEEDIAIQRCAIFFFFLLLPLLIGIMLCLVFFVFPFYLIYVFFSKITKWMNEELNPKLQLAITLKIFCLKQGNFICSALFALTTFLLFIPRAILYTIFIGPVKYIIGVAHISHSFFL